MLYVSGHLRRTLSAAVATVAILGAGHVAAAQAAPTFSVTNTALTTAPAGPAPTISLTKTGSPSVTLTCPTLKPGGGFTMNSGVPAQGSWAGSGMVQRPCTGSNGATYYVSISTPNFLYLNVVGAGFAVTTSQPVTFSLSGGPNPGGEGVASTSAYSMAWTNGSSGPSPSKVSLNNTLLGTTTSPYSDKHNLTVRITGQWSIATTGGGLITALP